MPYITQAKREDLNIILSSGYLETPGELNYALTKLLSAYQTIHGLNYRTINDILGALEGAKLEYYRRVAIPYENTKLVENGDVYSAPPPYPSDQVESHWKGESQE